MPPRRTLLVGFLLFFLAINALIAFCMFAWNSKELVRKETRQFRDGPQVGLIAQFEVKTYRFRPIVILEFQTERVGVSYDNRINFNATGLKAVKQVEWLENNKAVVITLVEDYDSDGQDHIDKVFYDFARNQYMTTHSFGTTDKDFTDFLQKWQAAQKQLR